jgi:hypothetical protein
MNIAKSPPLDYAPTMPASNPTERQIQSAFPRKNEGTIHGKALKGDQNE